ncbi:MAG: PAS domain-containing protein [Proteobacteria bacterium]|nr:PAS domain-containing protein [Pseudomonadota bacterium]
MSFAEFLSRIENSGLRNVAEHWNAARGTRRMPGWSDIEPGAIARQLPIVWAWNYDRGADRFTGRLAGEEINAAFGKSLRGADMAEFFKEFEYEVIVERYRRIVNEPCFFYGDGQVFRHVQRVGVGERIIMPLAADGEIADGLIGATLYKFRTSEVPADRPSMGQNVTFIPLA